MDSADKSDRVTQNHELELVRDFESGRIIYYWRDPTGEILSPAIASLTLAEEWRNTYLWQGYQGRQRRGTPLDRRRHAHKRELHPRAANVSALFNGGRRASDRVVKLKIDLAAEKIEALKAEICTSEPDETVRHYRGQ